MWSHAKRTGVARGPLQKGEYLEERVHEQLQAIADNPDGCVRSSSITVLAPHRSVIAAVSC